MIKLIGFGLTVYLLYRTGLGKKVLELAGMSLSYIFDKFNFLKDVLNEHKQGKERVARFYRNRSKQYKLNNEF